MSYRTRSNSSPKRSAAPQYSVILPTYNERDNLPLMMSMLNTAFDEAALAYEVVVVEDNSPDGTLEVAKALQKVYGGDRIVILPRPGKLGLGSMCL